MKKTRYLSIHAIANLTGISRKTVKKRIESMELPHAAENGNGKLYRLADVLKILVFCGHCRGWIKSHKEHIKRWTTYYNPPK
ncbi:MAG: hypothetical protein ACK4UN_08140 [Limisphaerales bacterium]